MDFRKAWKPAVAPATRQDVWRVGLGGMLGLALASLLVWGCQQLGIPAGLNLFAPLGASAVLLFAVHTSPLAQPWSCVVGNTVAGLWTWLVVSCVPLDWAPALAVGGAIMVMQLTRSLHPPGGAVALLWALDAQHGTVHGWTYALWPIGVLTLCLVLVAIVYHRVCGKRYPLQPVAMSTAGMQQLPTKALSEADLQALLSRFDQSNNLTAQELQQLVLAAEEQAIARRFGSVHCGQLMTTAMWTCSPRESLASLAAKVQQQPSKRLPVVGVQGELLGVVARSALLDWLWQQRGNVAQRRQQRVWRLWGKKPAQPTACAADLMADAPLCVQDSTPVSQLLAVLAEHAVPFVAVLRQGRLVGLITRTDIMRLLLH